MDMVIYCSVFNSVAAVYRVSNACFSLL